MQSTIINQDGVQFTRTVQAFDAFVREVSVVEANSAGQSRTSSTSYYDNPALWVNGQTARSVLNGIEQSRTEFDTTKALPLRAYAFGRLAQQVTYAADGTVASVPMALEIPAICRDGSVVFRSSSACRPRPKRPMVRCARLSSTTTVGSPR